MSIFKEDIIDFINKFEASDEQNKIKLVNNTNYGFLRAVCSFCQLKEKSYLSEEVISIQKNIDEKWEKDIGKQIYLDKIEYLKRDISSLLLELDKKDNNVLTTEQINILEEFFQKTNVLVIERMLESIKKRLTERKKDFRVNIPAIRFQNGKYSDATLHYLEDRYHEKFKELQLDEMGISEVSLTHHTFQQTKDKSLLIDYEEEKSSKNFKYNDYSYVLSARCKFLKNKVLVKENRT